MRRAIQRASKVLTTSPGGPKLNDVSQLSFSAETVEALKETLAASNKRLGAAVARADEAEAAAGVARAHAKEADAEAKSKGLLAEKLALQLEGRDAEVGLHAYVIFVCERFETARASP
jgi:hypothetical protein